MYGIYAGHLVVQFAVPTLCLTLNANKSESNFYRLKNQIF